MSPLAFLPGCPASAGNGRLLRELYPRNGAARSPPTAPVIFSWFLIKGVVVARLGMTDAPQSLA